MKVILNREEDALYFHLGDEKVIESEEVQPGVILDFNEDNQVVGIELLNVSRRVPEISLKQMMFETV